MDSTLIFNGVDFSQWLSTYAVTHEVTYAKVITTLDGTEHTTPGTRRPIVIFSFKPLSDARAAQYYAALSALVAPATYTDPWQGGTSKTADMRVTSNLDAVFGIRSIDGNRYYKGEEIQLRAVSIL